MYFGSWFQRVGPLVLALLFVVGEDGQVVAGYGGTKLLASWWPGKQSEIRKGWGHDVITQNLPLVTFFL